MKKIARRLLLVLFEISLQLQWYTISKVLFCFYLRILAGTSSGERCIYGKKTVFQSEMAVISKYINLSVLAIDRSYLRAVVHHFFERESNFHLPTENKLSPRPGNKCQFEEYCQSFFWPILEKFNVTTWISCDFIYYYERPFQELCEGQGIESVVLMKECYKSPAQHLAWSHYLIENFGDGIPASRVGVTNKRMKEIIINAGLSRSDAIEVVGSPRLEELAFRLGSNRKSIDDVDSPLVIFFESGVKSGLPRFGVRSEVHEILGTLNLSRSAYEEISELWRQLQQKILIDSLTFADRNPAVSVIYKQKTGASTPILPETTADLKNWRRMVGGNNTDLLGAARLCVGFNTSAILEAVFSNVPVFSPLIPEPAEYELAPFLMDYGDCVTQYKDVSELFSSLKAKNGRFALSNVYDSLAAASDDGAFSTRVSWPNVQRLLGK